MNCSDKFTILDADRDTHQIPMSHIFLEMATSHKVLILVILGGSSRNVFQETFQFQTESKLKNFITEYLTTSIESQSKCWLDSCRSKDKRIYSIELDCDQQQRIHFDLYSPENIRLSKKKYNAFFRQQ